MDLHSTRRLRTSSSRNFSRPFPSPLSTGALNTPTRPSKASDFLSQLPLSANPSNNLKRATSHENLATGRFINFSTVSLFSHPPKPIPYSNQTIHRDEDQHAFSSTSSPISAASSSSDLSFDYDLGTTTPIRTFRPYLWRLLDPRREILKLDLLWPLDPETLRQEDDQLNNAEPKFFPYDGLRPLLLFRNLHMLQLVGMLTSYQPLIWATCWLNPNLTTLHLEMALEPLINVSNDLPHRHIDATWSLRSNFLGEEEEQEYLGHHGTGTLHEEFGDGEYLDTQAIKMAALDVADHITELDVQRLPIKRLTLMNFVIDGWPIMRWFDPRELEQINFKSGCIDAGFYLPYHMMHIKVQAATSSASVAKVIQPGKLKVLELKKGQVVSSQDAATARSGLTSVTKGGADSKEHTLRHKISQLFPRMPRRGSLRKNKENMPNVIEPQADQSSNMNNLRLFSDDEIRAAKDGKKPLR